jgi:hypothetical protein
MNHITGLDSFFMSLSMKVFLKLANELAEEIHLPLRFNDENKSTGKKKDFYRNINS